MGHYLVTSVLIGFMLVNLTGRGMQSTALDLVKMEVSMRYNAIDDGADRQERRLKRVCWLVLQDLDRESSSWQTDGWLLTRVVLRLDRVAGDDETMQNLLSGAVDRFLDDMAGDLEWMAEGLALTDPDNRYRQRAETWLDRANDMTALAITESNERWQVFRARRAAVFTHMAFRVVLMAMEADGVWPAESSFSHNAYFTSHDYDGTSSCLRCHGDIGDNILTTGHWNWQGMTTNVAGQQREMHGKQDFINNFCIAVPTNEPRCTQCHIGVGYANKSFDFTDPTQIDCLVCHDQTGTYAKDPKKAGAPAASVDLAAVARSVATNGGVPTRKACGSCHFSAGGGDNVKHGDLSTDLIATTREYDVHMGTDGANMVCADCHGVERDAKGEMVSHGIGGMPYHSVSDGNMRQCTDCHDGNPHAGSPEVNQMVSSHPTLACQVCHIPAIARKNATKTEWYWETAGDSDRAPVIDPETGKPDYDKMKGDFVWTKNVRPVLKRFNGKWDRMVMNENDTFTSTPVVLGEPLSRPDSKIYPFKKMIGNQVADAVNNRILVPHLFGTGTGPNPYWGKFDWDLALQDGAAYTGQAYSGSFTFVPTVMYLTVNHEIAPKEQALGYGGSCVECHAPGMIDWEELGRLPPLGE